MKTFSFTKTENGSVKAVTNINAIEGVAVIKQKAILGFKKRGPQQILVDISGVNYSAYIINVFYDEVTIGATTYAPGELTVDEMLDAFGASDVFPDANSGSSGSGVGTYAEMIAKGTPSVTTIYKVANDENKGQTNTIYQVWPDGTRVWMAAAIDN